MNLELRLLGQPQILVDGKPVRSLPLKGQALLFYLALHSQPVTRQKLAGLLWGRLPEKAARRNLRGVLLRLREELAGVLFVTRREIGLEWSGCWVDVHELEATAGYATGSPKQLQALESALAHYRGEFLTDLHLPDAEEFDQWLLVERERLHQLAFAGWQTVAAAYRDREEWDRALNAARKLVRLARWQEAAHRELIELLALAGQRSAALAQFEICRQVLADEFGVEPGPGTQELYEWIRRGNFPPAEDPC